MMKQNAYDISTLIHELNHNTEIYETVVSIVGKQPNEVQCS